MTRLFRRLLRLAEEATVQPAIRDLRDRQDELDRRVRFLERQRTYYRQQHRT